MYESLEPLALKSGERVEAGVVRGPDAAWADRVEDLLRHKGEVWRWQNAACLRQELGVDVAFYLLHRNGEPFASMLTVTTAGVGHFGHVFTRPEARRQGAARGLMGRAMADFQRRGGRALFLGTGFDSAPYHIYRGHGFAGLEPESGLMEFYTGKAAEFRAEWFAEGPVEVVEPGWRHWPASAPLFTGPFPGVLRWVTQGLFGRSTTEGPWLQLLHEDPERARVLVRRGTDVVVGVAAWAPDPIWPRSAHLDVWCHPAYWSYAGALLEALKLPAMERLLAYCDDEAPQRGAALEAAGLRRIGRCARRIAADAARRRLVDVWALEGEGNSSQD